MYFLSCPGLGDFVWFIESKAGHFAGLITVNTTNRFLPVQSSPVHTGNPGIEKSKKFISLNIAIIVGVKTDLVGARLSMEGSIIKS